MKEQVHCSADPPEPEEGIVVRARKSRRWRRALTAILLVLSCLTVLVSSVSIWAHRTVFNTDQWVATVGPLAQNPDVVKSVADHVTAQLDNTIKPEQTAKNLLPKALDRFAAPIGQGFEQIVHGAVTRIIETDQFQKFWIAANTQVHARVIAVLKGKPTPHLTTSNGDITLNLLPAYSKILKVVDSKASGLLNAKGPIPTITADTPVDQARSELSAALGRDLPENFGTPVLFHSDELASAQHLVHVFNTLIIALVIVTVALIAGTVVVAERRRRTIIALGIGIVVAMTLAVVLTKVITNQVVSSITSPDDRGAVQGHNYLGAQGPERHQCDSHRGGAGLRHFGVPHGTEPLRRFGPAPRRGDRADPHGPEPRRYGAALPGLDGAVPTAAGARRSGHRSPGADFRRARLGGRAGHDPGGRGVRGTGRVGVAELRARSGEWRRE